MSQICNGFDPMLYKMLRNPAWYVLRNIWTRKVPYKTPAVRESTRRQQRSGPAGCVRVRVRCAPGCRESMQTKQSCATQDAGR